MKEKKTAETGRPFDSAVHRKNPMFEEKESNGI